MNDKEFINNVLNNLDESSNKDLSKSLDLLNQDFEITKVSIINLTHHLDNIEIVYNKILKELEKRNV